MNIPNTEPTQEQVKEFFQYTPETGGFMRIKSIAFRRRDMVGRESGSRNKATDYVVMSIFGARQYAHRLAWIYVHGAIPEGFYIDHINGVRSDNRIENLRLARHAENLRNCKKRVDNTSGIKGVSYDKERGKWWAYVRSRRLGRFDTLFEAAAARQSAANAEFGAFARE